MISRSLKTYHFKISFFNIKHKQSNEFRDQRPACSDWPDGAGK